MASRGVLFWPPFVPSLEINTVSLPAQSTCTSYLTHPLSSVLCPLPTALASFPLDTPSLQQKPSTVPLLQGLSDFGCAKL